MYPTVFLTLLTCVIAFAVSCSPAPQRPVSVGWVFALYMSYDNDLEPNGPIILDALKNGVRHSDIVVTVLADDTDKNGLKRHVITTKGMMTEMLQSDDSASAQVVEDYFTWVAKNYPAHHYALIFLDHGGRLDEMCLDECPGTDGNEKWLSARLVGEALRKFRQHTPGTVELLFLQQCGRGSVENLYNFRGTANAVMASQLGVGAPNTYYMATLRWLAGHADATGRELAHQIIASEEKYNSYVVVDGAALAELPSRIDAVVTALNLDKTIPLMLPSCVPACYQYQDERFFDAAGWLEAAFRENTRSTDQLEKFIVWSREKLIFEHAIQPEQRKTLSGLCGLSLFVPETAMACDTYADYPFFKAGSLVELWKAARR